MERNEQDFLRETERVRFDWESIGAGDEYTRMLSTTFKVGSQLVSELSLEHAQNVLEVGCGPGLLTTLIADLIPTSASLMATDIAESMVNRCKGRIFSRQVSVENLDAQELKTIPDDSFDRYIGNLCLMLVPDPDKMIQECFRVLTSQGIAGLSLPSEPESDDVLWKMLRSFAPRAGDPRDLADIPVPFLRESPDAIRSRFLKAGFSQAVCWRYRAIISALDATQAADLILNSHISHFLPFLKSLTQQDKPKYIQELAEFFRTEMLGKGTPIGFETILVVVKKYNSESFLSFNWTLKANNASNFQCCMQQRRRSRFDFG